MGDVAVPVLCRLTPEFGRRLLNREPANTNGKRAAALQVAAVFLNAGRQIASLAAGHTSVHFDNASGGQAAEDRLAEVRRQVLYPPVCKLMGTHDLLRVNARGRVGSG